MSWLGITHDGPDEDNNPADQVWEQHWDFAAIDVNVRDTATTPAERFAALLTLREWEGARRVVAKQCWGGRGCW